NLEAASLNRCILGQTVGRAAPEFDLFIGEGAREMTVKAGQKCTAIRRIIVPRGRLDEVQTALARRLDGVTLGDPAVDGVRMGPLVGREQREDVWGNVERLIRSSEIVYGGRREFEVRGADPEKGAFFPATLLYCGKPLAVAEPHEVEAFGPVATLMPYEGVDEAAALARMGRGSLAGSIFTHDDAEARELVLE